jgi:hypothetical protein
MKILYIGGVAVRRRLAQLARSGGRTARRAVQSYFLMPQGTALDFYRRVATNTLAVRGIGRLDHTRSTNYRGVRWLVLLRETFPARRTFIGLLRAQNRWS